MPAQKGTCSLSSKLGNRIDGFVKKHAGDATESGRIQLPGGITNGIAQIDECGFKEYENGDMKGEPYFYARGIIIEPVAVMTAQGERKVRGMHTYLRKPICVTKTQKGKVTSLDENLAVAMNEMRKLGVATTGKTTARDLDTLATLIAKARPYFHFSTSQSKPTPEFPDPRVWENWFGCEGLESYMPPEDSGTIDETAGASEEEEPSTNGVATTAAVTGFDETAGGVAVEDEPTGEEDDLTELVKGAENGEDEAIQALIQAALDAGLTEEDVTGEDSGTWAEVTDKIRLARESETEEAPKERIPKKEDVYYYLPKGKDGKPLMDPRTKKPMKRSEVEVAAVNTAKRTVDVKNNATKVIMKGVPWDALEET